MNVDARQRPKEPKDRQGKDDLPDDFLQEQQENITLYNNILIFKNN